MAAPADPAALPREWLVPMLYEHLLVHLRRAGDEIARRDRAALGPCVERARAILAELHATLDHHRGGEIASRLAALYVWFGGELAGLVVSLDAEHLARLERMIAGLHGAWVRAAEQVAPAPAA